MGVSQLKTFAKRAFMPRTTAAADNPVPSSVSEYCIRKGYCHRPDNRIYDDTDLEDQWQREVYEWAVEEALDIDARTVFDIGCGAGFKLMKHFAGIRTVGFDLKPMVSFLKKKYPGRDWRVSNFKVTI